MDRKNFFTTAGRLLLLGGLAGSTVFLITKNRISAECTVSAACKNCGSLNTCTLPRAEKYNLSEKNRLKSGKDNPDTAK